MTIRNGEVTIRVTDEGQTATYHCLSGYKLVGNKYRICQENAEWSGQDPVCERKHINFVIILLDRIFIST